MKDEHDFFTPEQVDQQVEHLAPDNPVIHLTRKKLPERTSPAEECLVNDLQGYYRDERAQDLASLTRAWQQVSTHLADGQERSRPLDPLPVKILRSSHERTRMMRKHTSDTPNRGKFWRGLNTLAAVLVAIALVGGMVVVFKMVHATPTTHKQSTTKTASAATPTPPTLQAVPSSPGLYLITQADASENSQVTKVDKDTGAVLWNHPIGLSESPAIVGDNIVFGASNGNYVYALNAKNGSQLWGVYVPISSGGTQSISGTQIQINIVGVLTTPTFANGVLYVTSGFGDVYALNAANGAIIWKTNVQAMDFNTTHASQFVNPLTVANGVVYGATFNKLYALNAQNGHMLWSTSVKDDGYSFGAPTVADGKVYLSLDPASTHTAGNPDKSYIVAYSADNGAQIWKSDGYYWAGFLNYAPVVENGLVYVANFDTGIYALDGQNGQTRWQHVLGTDAFNNPDGCSWPVVANGVVYANCGNNAQEIVGNHKLNAYNATNGDVIWSRTSDANPDAVNGDVIYSTAFPGLVYFAKIANGTTTYQQTYGTLVKNKFGDPSAPEPNLTLVP